MFLSRLRGIYSFFTARRYKELKEGYVQILIKMKMVLTRQTSECTSKEMQ
jgi:hypothetical protein